MSNTGCTISFFKNDLQRSRLLHNDCPVKGCSVKIKDYLVPFRRDKRRGVIYKPSCPEHNIRVHNSSGFVYYNGSAADNLIAATKRNLMFNADYYISNFFGTGAKVESGRLCYENSEDAVSYNIFTEILSDRHALKKLLNYITGQEVHDNIDLYLWGRKIDFENKVTDLYPPLTEIRKILEPGRKGPPKPPTEPDIMLIVPKRLIVLIEAKFGSKNPIAEDEAKQNRRRRTARELIEDYCFKNPFDMKSIFVDYNKMPHLFYEQLFRNIVFAASMAKVARIDEWYVANLRNQHLMNMRRGQPESMPIKRNVLSMLRPLHERKHRFTHLTWEDIYTLVVKDNNNLLNLAWYLKNKSFGCGRAFNIL